MDIILLATHLICQAIHNHHSLDVVYKIIYPGDKAKTFGVAAVYVGYSISMATHESKINYNNEFHVKMVVIILLLIY
jgi:hypothetical protein